MTADELRPDGGLSGRLTARLNDLVFGAPLVGLVGEMDRVSDAIPVSPNLDPETRSVVAPFYVPVDYANGRGSRFRLFSPPAGQAVATMNRSLLVAAFPEYLMEKSRAPRS